MRFPPKLGIWPGFSWGSFAMPGTRSSPRRHGRRQDRGACLRQWGHRDAAKENSDSFVPTTNAHGQSLTAPTARSVRLRCGICFNSLVRGGYRISFR